ncbi:lamin tail domain-containing protein [Polaribacter sp. M15]
MKQKNLLKIAFTLLLALSFSTISAQIYNADFSTNGDGFADHTSASPPADAPASVGPFGSAGNQWSLSYTSKPGTDGSANSFKVVDGALLSDDWGGQGIFQSQSIDVSSINTVDISAISQNSGANDDNFTYFYILDGGSRVETPIGETNNGDPVSYSISGLDVSGANSLVVGFEFSENGAGDGYSTSSFTVSESGGTPSPTVSFDSASSAETETDATFATSGIPITLTNYDADVTITATVNGSSTAEPGDYTIDLTPLIFDANETLNLPLSINNDADFEDETIIIDFTVTSGTADLGTSTHTVTITDNDTPASIGFDAATSSETETDATFNVLIPVTVSNYSDTQIDVDVTISGTAEGSDYTLNTSSLTFTANGSQNISLDINPDTDDYDNETIILTISETSAVSGLTISEATHTITLTDDDEDPNANTLITTIDFETVNDGYTPSTTVGSGNSDTFNRVQAGANGNSTFYWVAEDLTGDPSIDLSQIDISDAASFTFAIDFSYNNDAQWDSTDELLITYSIDGESYQNLMAVQHINSDGFNNPAALDLDFDGDGDLGQELSTSTFTTFTTSDIVLSSNSTLDIKLQFNNLTSNGEGIFIDNIVITETPASSDPTVTFDAVSSSQTETDVTFATAGIPITLTNYDANVTVTATVNESSTAEAGDYTIDLTPLVFDANETLNIPLSINSDVDFQDETIVIDIAVTNGTADITTSQHTVTITDNDLPQLFISEIMYDSRSVYGSDDEWIELYNGSGSDIDISNYTLEYNSITFTFPSSTTFTNNTYIVVAVGSNGDGTFNNDNPFTPDFNNLSVSNAAVATTDDSNNLTNTSRSIELKNTGGATIDIVTYSEADGADSNGSTFELIDTSADNSATSSNWQESGIFGGSPKALGSSIWSGAVSSDWSVAGNWNAFGVPSTNSNFVIPNGLTNYPVASSSVTVNNGLIKSGATLIAQSTFTGTVTYERTLGTTNWYLISSPVSGETYNSEWVAASNIDDTNGTGSNIGIASYTTATNSWSYVQAESSGTFSNGAGYSIKQNFAGDIYFTGAINTANVSVNVLDDGSGFNVVGNPFTANLTSASFLTDNTDNLVSQTLWVWNQATGVYDTYVTGDNFVLAPTQGFFIQANADTSLIFNESYQTTTSGTFQKSEKTEIKLWITDGKKQRYSRINYAPNATTGFDNGYDGEIFGGVYRGEENSFDVFTNLVGNNTGKKYQVQTLPNSGFENMIIPIGITADADQKITFTAETLNLPTGIKVFLEDTETNTFTRLDEVVSEYTISLTEKVDGVGRFYLHTKSSALSTSEVSLGNVSIYTPNASTLRITGLTQGKANVKLFNILGKQVVNESFSSNSVKEINLPNLASGIYVVQLTTETGQLNKKITLE